MIWQTFPKQIIKFGRLNKKDTTICKNYLQCLQTSLSTPRLLPFFFNYSLTFHQPWSKKYWRHFVTISSSGKRVLLWNPVHSKKFWNKPSIHSFYGLILNKLIELWFCIYFKNLFYLLSIIYELICYFEFFFVDFSVRFALY